MDSLIRTLRILLAPLTPLYRFVIRVRNDFFDKGKFRTEKVNALVISVGNLTVGGSGKTPMVIYISRLFKKLGFDVGVLSRGYMRSTKGYLYVSDGEKIFHDVNEAGDEIHQTVIECGVKAAVSENRVKGAQRLIEDSGVSLIVLDDGFQHRWIHRDLDIVLFDQRFLTTEDKYEKMLLPTGNLREPYESLKRADVIIINRKFSEKQEIPVEIKKYFLRKPVFYGFYHAVGFVDVKNEEFFDIKDFVGQKSLIINGIANPDSFFKVLNSLSVDTASRMIFLDHNKYNNDEVQKIRKEFYSSNSSSVITTHKDAVKLNRFKRELDDIDIYYLKIEMEIENNKEFEELILQRIKS